MILFGNALIGVAQILDMLLTLYLYIIIGAVIVSWVGADPYNPIVRFLRSMTDPLFYRARRTFPFLAVGGIDFSPMLVVFAIIFLQRAIVPTLIEYGGRLKVG